MKKNNLYLYAIIVLCTFFPCFTKAQTPWDILGNAGTTAGTNFLGTTDNNDLVLKRNSTEVLRFDQYNKAVFTSDPYIDCATFSSSNWYGAWVYANSNSANPATGVGYRFTVNGAVKSQIFFNEGAFGYGTVLHGIVGNTEILSMAGDVLLSTNLFRTNGLIVKNTTGRVGIGTLTPGNKLEVTQGTSGNSGLRFTNLTSSSTAGTSSGKVLSLNSSGDVVLEAATVSPWTITGTDIYNSNTGNVGIGTSSPQYLMDINGTARVMGKLIVGNDTYTFPSAYSLAVDSGIITEKLKIRTRANWPDYVFKKGFQLPVLRDVENYIRQNDHLPGIPSAEEVKKEGFETGDMNAKLLQKIEELTLYMISADKEIKDLKKQVEELKQKNN